MFKKNQHNYFEEETVARRKAALKRILFSTNNMNYIEGCFAVLSDLGA